MQSPPVPDEDRGPRFLACVTITTVAALITVTLRFHVRANIVNAVGWDDWIILIAMIFSIILLAATGKQISLGYGRHTYYVEQYLVEQIKFDTLVTVFVVIASCLSKISICIFILRLLGKAAVKMGKWFLYILVLIISVANLVDVVSLLVQCRPTAKIWNRKLDGTCWSPVVQEGFACMQGVISIFAAFALSAFPAFIFKGLQLNLRTKVALCILMGLGVLDGVCSLVRVTMIPGFNANTDYSYTSVPIATWGVLEVNLSIIAACIPSIRPLFQFFDRTQDSPPYQRKRQGYPMRKWPSHRISLFTTRIGFTDEEFGLRTFVSARPDRDPADDTGSQKSILPSRDPSTIRKTTQIDVSS